MFTEANSNTKYLTWQEKSFTVLDMTDLLDRIRVCDRCPELCKDRKNVVIGEGPIPAGIVFLGEAPGAEEERTGRPFVGASGTLLRTMIFQAGISGYHILNRLKCRPPDNRPPEPEELINCRPFLKEQLELIKPKVIVALGRYAQSAFIAGDPLDIKVTRIAGKVLELPEYRVILTYHPSFVMRHRNREIQRFFGNHLRLAKQLEAGCPLSVLP